MATQRINLIGRVYSRLTVMSYAGRSADHRSYWFCDCECGKTVPIRGDLLESGNTRSCGCLLIDSATRHGHSNSRKKASPSYVSWMSMIARCTNPDHEHYPKYGGVGISVCKRWRDFCNFLEDMGERPPGMTLDRFPDKSGNYEKSNCRWATSRQQSANRWNTKNTPPPSILNSMPIVAPTDQGLIVPLAPARRVPLLLFVDDEDDPPPARHGHSRGGNQSRTYHTWSSMIERCRNPNSAGYDRYGGRGIMVCERWHSFENFLADMGERPEGTSLDRFPDNNGNYEPGNTRWASRSEQARNTQRNRIITFHGQAYCLTEWAEKIGIDPHTLRDRLRHGWPIAEALTGVLRKVRGRLSDGTSKQCSRCKEIKPVEHFGFAKRSKDGRQHYCNVCRNAAMREHRARKRLR